MLLRLRDAAVSAAREAVTTTFRPAEHIRRRADFERIYRTAYKLSGRFLTMFATAGNGSAARLGIAATRKIGGAVIRNRAKRLTRELFRHHKPIAGFDVIVIPRREFVHAPYASLEREFISLLERACRHRPQPSTPETRRPGSARSAAGL